MVPEPSRSPGHILQPETEWWASCCFIVQYMYLMLELLTVLGPAPSAAMHGDMVWRFGAERGHDRVKM